VIIAPATADLGRSSTYGRATAALFFAAIALVFLGLTISALDWPSHAVVWGGLALAACGLAFLFALGARQGDLGLARWQLGPWNLLWYAIAFGVATVTWSQPQVGLATEIAVTSVLRALWLVSVGLALWMLGYLVGPGRLLRQYLTAMMAKIGRRFTTEVRSPLAPWILYSIGIAARLASTATTGRFGYTGDASTVVTTATGYGQILTALTLCAPLAVAAAALQVYRERKTSARITLVILFVSELVFGAAAGGKQSFVIAVLAVAIPFSAARRRMPVVSLLAFILVFLVIIIPFNKAYRSTVRAGSTTLTPSEAIGEAPSIFQQTIAGQNPIMTIPDSLDYLLQRIREIDSPAIIVQRTPMQVGFISPIQLVVGPVIGVVPRAIWPGKPILLSGYEVSQLYYELPSTVYTSSAVTPVGDLYRHGGWIPVIIGMFFLGCGVRLLDDVLDVRGNAHAVFLVLLVFPIVVKNEVDWVTLLAAIPSTLLVWLLGVALAFKARSAA
jgi:hypothetical protein